MINRIIITSLFNRFDYTIDINTEGLTILTGPNGFGKSTILKIINALGSGIPVVFASIEFKNIEIQFDNNLSYSISKKDDFLFFDKTKVHSKSLLDFADTYPWINRTNNVYSDLRYNDILTENELWERYFYNIDINLSRLSNSYTKFDDLRKELTKVKKLCGDVRFISDQRLFKADKTRRDSQRIIDVIKELPKSLKSEISKVYEEYSKKASDIDSSYPRRLLTSTSGISDQCEYLEKLKITNEMFSKLNQYNLVDMQIIDKNQYDPRYSNALLIYFNDFANKYAVFEELISKLDLFTDIINKRLSFKKIEINRDDGFRIVDLENSDKILDLSQLSSGEKQEIVLFYELIFNTKEQLLLLIDEPEISLHINWQREFINDLIEVAKLIKMRAVIATHSPQIVGNHRDLQIDLGGLYAEQFNL